MKIKLGLKALSLAPAMLVSLAMISGCNDEGASTPPAGTASPTPAPGAGKPADIKKPEAATPPAPPADKAKDAEKK
ncbi:MAG: hypothetical protein ACYC61_23365 [Isosphaeraceae bacterium]